MIAGFKEQRPGLAVPYSSEYVGMGVDREHLRDLAAATGGRLLPLTSASLAAVTAANPQAVGHRWRLWWPLLVAALILLMCEVAVRKVALPESWRLRWQRLRDRPRQTIEDEPEYEELRANIAKVREQHLEALRGRIHYRPDDPGVRARLYLASFKSSGR